MTIEVRYDGNGWLSSVLAAAVDCRRYRWLSADWLERATASQTNGWKARAKKGKREQECLSLSALLSMRLVRTIER